MTDQRKDELLASGATEVQTTAVHGQQEGELHLQGVIELREERLVVARERQVAGSVTFTREVRRETVQLPAELVTEVLIIEHLGDGGAAGEHLVTLDGQPLMPGERREVLVYREEAHVDKRVVLREQLRISKRQVVETRTLDATLAREELVVTPQGDVRVTEQPWEDGRSS